jgi:putative nucleotidyltransferase with HDIG domain
MPDEDAHRVAAYARGVPSRRDATDHFQMPPLQSARARAGRVLLASGSPHTQATLRAMLAGCDAVREIHEAWSLPEACGLARSADLVLFEATEAGRLGVTAALEDLRASGAPAVIVVAADSDPEAVRASLRAGATSFVLTWSDLRALHATVAAALDGQGLVPAEVVRPALEQAHGRIRAVVESLALAVEAKDSVTSRHLRSVTLLAVQLARQIDQEIAESDEFRYGCLLHDVGKIGVPERILGKPGPLDEDEWVVMRSHPDTGARVVEPLGLPQTVVDIVRHHHERWDGLGYPDGLAGEEIPLAARIFAVCDALDAMTSERPYRDPLPHSIAYARVRREAGRQFDPAVVGALERGVLRGEIELGEQATSTRSASARSRRRRMGNGATAPYARPAVARSL